MLHRVIRTIGPPLRRWCEVSQFLALGVLLGAVVGGSLWWIRSERGWAPGATVREAASEAKGRLFPSPPRTKKVVLRRLWRTARSQAVVGVGGRVLVPSVITFELHPDDLALLAGLEKWACADVAAALKAHAVKQDWELTADPVVVMLKPDPDRPPGRPRATTSFPAATQVQALETSLATTVFDCQELRGLDGAPRFLLTGSRPLVLGRAPHCDLHLDDPAVSRRHAMFTPVGDGGWMVADLGAKNGLLVNGDRITEQHLREGDVVKVSKRSQFRYEARR